MPRTALPRALTAAAVLFGLVSTGFASIALVKAPHNFPSLRAVTARSDAANQSSTVRSDHVALLIANSNYPDAAVPLPEVAAGADLLANVLRSHGFVVDVVRDATHAGITEAVSRLKAETRPGSVVLVYFGGFGVQSRGQNYMIPVDAKIWEERDVRRDGVGVEKTLSELSTSGARKRIAIVDASRRNPYERRFREYSHGLAPIEKDGNSIVIASTPPEQVAEDAGTLPNRFVNGLAAEISPSSLPVEEILAAKAAVSAGDRREQEHSEVPVASNVNS
jgi:Caspase domain